MSVTPKVYRFSPGAKTPAAIIDGVNRVMISTLGDHHWEVVANSYTSGTTITLRDKATGNRRLRLVAALSGTPNPTVDCYYSHNAGVNESYKCWMSGGNTTYEINDPAWGISSDIAFVVELEDAITIVSEKGNGGTGFLANALGMGVHAGRVGSAHNKSDSALGVGEEGMLCGVLSVYGGSDARWAMLPDFRTGAQNAIWTGATYERVCFGVSGTAQTQWRDKRDASAARLVENVGDGQSIERLTPFPLIYQTAAGVPFGHVSYTRYIRARKYGYNDTLPLGGTVNNQTILPSAGDPAIGWRHNTVLSNTSTQINTIHIWCPTSGAVIPVP